MCVNYNCEKLGRSLDDLEKIREHGAPLGNEGSLKQEVKASNGSTAKESGTVYTKR